MTNALREELFKLSTAERLELVEELWDSIVAERQSEPFPLSAAQREELDRASRNSTSTRNELARGRRCASAFGLGSESDLPLALSPAAEDDLRDAAEWYDAQQPGLGDAFLRFRRGELRAHSSPAAILPHRRKRRSLCLGWGARVGSIRRSASLPSRPVRVVGLMSGTSADGVDAALVEWPDSAEARPFRLLAFHGDPFPSSLQERIHRLAAGRVAPGEALRELAALDVALGQRFAEAALAVCRAAGLGADAVASHGQTVAHHPALRATLQIGDPSVIAERTGLTTVADFRPRDVAAGGEGAPLAPFFHYAAFADPREGRAALNLGGIANVTWIPPGAGPDDVVAFDVGPANALLDGVVRVQSEGRERMDRDGARALRGRVDADLLARLLDDEFLRRPPPKSTGRERYGSAEAEALAREWREGGREGDDLVATLTAFTVEAVRRACADLLGSAARVERLLVGGGGAENPALMQGLARALPGARVEPFDAAGVPARAAEAMAFSLLGRNALLGIPNHLPRCTGARRAAVLGEIVPGRSGRVSRHP